MQLHRAATSKRAQSPEALQSKINYSIDESTRLLLELFNKRLLISTHRNMEALVFPHRSSKPCHRKSLLQLTMILEFYYCACDGVGYDGHDHDHVDDDDDGADLVHFYDEDGHHDDVADWKANHHYCYFVSTINCMFDAYHNIFRSNDQL